MVERMSLDKEIKDSVYAVLNEIVSYPKINFDLFEENKNQFFKDFGMNLIVEKRGVVTSRDPEIKEKEFHNFKKALLKYTEDYELLRFISQNGIEGFYQNLVIDNFKETVSIPKGMKLSKAFKYFLQPFDLNYWQTQYSQVLNSDKMSGNLCLSIHPLDYLSMSQNNHNWRSCQSLDGEYAAGTLSLMSDKSTIVAYLASDQKQSIEGFPPDVLWNSKKWRQLVHIDKTRSKFILSKNYPLYSEELEEQIIQMIKDLYPGNWIESKDFHRSSFIANAKTGGTKIHYNDVISGNNFTPRLFMDMNKDEDKKIIVGSRVACLNCGNYDIIDSQGFLCAGCGDHVVCDDCGALTYSEDAFYVNSTGSSICLDCYEANYSACDSCEESYPNHDLTHNEEEDSYLCENCL